MIIVKFKGGLGNQMFQYAMYLALKNQYSGENILVDCMAYKTQKVHNGFLLPYIYNIEIKDFILNRNSNYTPYGKFLYILASRLIKSYYKSRLLNNTVYIQDADLPVEKLPHLDRSKRYYFDGHWGNAGYFSQCRGQLLKAFTIKNTYNSLDPVVVKTIMESANSVSIHIRRKDYLNPASGFLNLSESQYYHNSIAYIKEKIPNPVFFIFSDDIEWCRKEFNLVKSYDHRFLDSNQGKDSYKDIHLMSLCRHNIIANSTFSWWGAWLNSNSHKTILCPCRLFNEPAKNQKVIQEFYPVDWIKIMF